MKYCLSILLLFVLISVSFAQSIQQEAVDKMENVDGVLQSNPQVNGEEVMRILNGYKSKIMSCLTKHNEHESICSYMILGLSANFYYRYTLAPNDGSKAWGIMAIGNGQNGFDQGDTVTMDSDESGQISCKATERLAGIC